MSDVIKREVLEGEKADQVKKRITRVANTALRSAKRGPVETAVTDAPPVDEKP